MGCKRFLNGALGLFVALFLTLAAGVEVDLPPLGKVIGVEAVTSAEQVPYITFHGIPYAEESSYIGANRFLPSKIKTTPFEKNPLPGNILIYCPQEEILDLSNITIPSEAEAKSQDLPGIYQALYQRKRQNSEWFRAHTSNREDVKRSVKEGNGPVKSMGQEDCLTLNINTPAIPTDTEDPEQLYPVVVFFHGGGSDAVWGSAFTGLRMLEHKVVLVTMNYRLGILGALNLGIDEAPGNAGQYDSIICLEWIKKYIKYFGGDPGRVTISGQSAGSMMVSNLMLTPMVAKNRPNLFHGVWGFSGSALSVWATAEHPSLKHHLMSSEFAGCYDSSVGNPDLKAIAACMREADLDTLVSALAAYKFQEESVGRLGFDAKVPSIQAPGLSHELYMPKHPYEVLLNGEQLSIPVVLGATRHDGSFPLDDIYNNYIKPSGFYKNETFIKNDLLPTLLQALGIRDDTGELYHSMAKTYLRESSLTGTIEDKLPGMLDMVTIMAFKAGQYETLRLHSKNKTDLCYFYSLDYMGRFSLYNLLWGQMDIPGGISHTDDLIYFFWLSPLLNEDMKVSRRWMNYFINFVNYGNPNGENIAPQDEIWPRYNGLIHPSISLNRTDKIIYNTPDTWIGPADELNWNINRTEPEPSSTTTTKTTTTTKPVTEPDASNASTQMIWTCSIVSCIFFLFLQSN